MKIKDDYRGKSMETLSKKDYLEIRSWVHRNARPLENALWDYHFEGKSVDLVLSILSEYQNEDGGFGHGIEPDNWNPESTPYYTTFAIEILRQIDFYDFSHPIYKGIFKYLENTEYQGPDGWFFTVPNNDLYPHAIWWTYNEEENKECQNIGVTADLSGFILRYGDKNTNIYEKAIKYTEMLLKRLKEDENLGDMGLLSYCALYQNLVSAGLQDIFDLSFLEETTRTLVRKHFHEYVWTNHQDMTCVLPNPSIYYYSEYKQEVSDALDELIRIRPKDGVWALPWEWYDNGKYTKEFAISENWWKAYKAIEKLLFLRVYGRLEM